MDEQRRYKIERTLSSLKLELAALEDLSKNLTVKVRASQETVDRIRRMAAELQSINRGDS